MREIRLAARWEHTGQTLLCVVCVSSIDYVTYAVSSVALVVVRKSHVLTTNNTTLANLHE